MTRNSDKRRFTPALVVKNVIATCLFLVPLRFVTLTPPSIDKLDSLAQVCRDFSISKYIFGELSTQSLFLSVRVKIPRRRSRDTATWRLDGHDIARVRHKSRKRVKALGSCNVNANSICRLPESSRLTVIHPAFLACLAHSPDKYPFARFHALI